LPRSVAATDSRQVEVEAENPAASMRFCDWHATDRVGHEGFGSSTPGCCLSDNSEG
jgi:hypothetical protein